MKIKYVELTEGCAPVINENGDAFDLRAAQDYEIKAPQAGKRYQKDLEHYRDVKFNNFTIVKLGIVVGLPKYIVADIKPRSSTNKKWYILQTNSPGLVDHTYNGCNHEEKKYDEWGMPVIATGTSHISKGDRVCQFELRPSQNAPWWVWLRWIFKGKIEFVKVDDLGTKKIRGGFGEGTKNVK